MTLENVLAGFQQLMGGGNTPAYMSAFMAASNDTLRDMAVKFPSFTHTAFTAMTDTVAVEDYEFPMFKAGVEYFLSRNYGEGMKEINELYRRYKEEFKTAIMGTTHAT